MHTGQLQHWPQHISDKRNKTMTIVDAVCALKNAHVFIFRLQKLTATVKHL